MIANLCCIKREIDMPDDAKKQDDHVLKIHDGFIDVRAIFDRSKTTTVKKETDHVQSSR